MTSPQPQHEFEGNAGLSADEIAAEKGRLGVPAGGHALRSWIRYRLQQVTHPKTGKPYTQADIGRETYTSESTVSIIYTGGRAHGFKSGRVRRLTAQVLEIPEAVLFPAQDATEKEKGD